MFGSCTGLVRRTRITCPVSVAQPSALAVDHVAYALIPHADREHRLDHAQRKVAQKNSASTSTVPASTRLVRQAWTVAARSAGVVDRIDEIVPWTARSPANSPGGPASPELGWT